MTVAVAQLKPVPGDIAANIASHLRLIEGASEADVLIFPELSLTGYVPERAAEWALALDDPRLDVFQHPRLTIGVGAPIRTAGGTAIGLVLFQPGKPRQCYFKHYLHADEGPFFVRAKSTARLPKPLALAICYELSIPEHADQAARNGAQIYLVSAEKTAKQLEAAQTRLAEIARTHRMTVLLANSLRSSIWDPDGALVAQLDDQEACLSRYVRI